MDPNVHEGFGAQANYGGWITSVMQQEDQLATDASSPRHTIPMMLHNLTCPRHGDAPRSVQHHARMAVVLLGNDSASEVYVRNKTLQTHCAGMLSVVYRLPESTSQAQLLHLIDRLNNDPEIHGILV